MASKAESTLANVRRLEGEKQATYKQGEALLARIKAARKAGRKAEATRLAKEFDENHLQRMGAHNAAIRRELGMPNESELEPLMAGNRDLDGNEGPEDFKMSTSTSRRGGFHETRPIAADESYRDFIQTRGDGNRRSGFTLGDFLAAAVDGPHTDAQREAMQASREARDMLAASDTAGGFLVPEMVAADVIEPLRAATTVIRAGAKVRPYTVHTRFPVQTSDPDTSTAHGEGGSITTTEITVGAHQPNVYTYSSILKCSRELLEDTSGLEELIRTSYAASAARTIDLVALTADGAAKPEGIGVLANRATLDLSATGLETYGAYDALLDLRTAILQANGDEPTGVIMSVREEGRYSKLKDGDGLPMPVPPALANVRRFSSTQVPTTGGVASNEAQIFLGAWNRLSILIRRDVTVTPLRERYADAGMVAFWFWLRFSTMVDHDQHFATVEHVLPIV